MTTDVLQVIETLELAGSPCGDGRGFGSGRLLDRVRWGFLLRAYGRATRRLSRATSCRRSPH